MSDDNLKRADRRMPPRPEATDSQRDEALRHIELALAARLDADFPRETEAEFPNEAPGDPAELFAIEDVGGPHGEGGAGNEAEQTLVETLENLLDAARSGHIVAMAGVTLHHDDEAELVLKGAIKPFILAGGLEGLKLLLLSRYISDR